ncbi:uncharacterized protein LOC112345224 [Selaginella moellendorffii]|uniref:uncharacterized protein LOC112345224 n=1 Tax=Selaginella moellendorffii TaxID=88036 RepID=UPI000D1C3CBB|nr:uncharacterized protein LOC112345224 [Selaginella moellendorffii]|eukprot:XP_024527326.1 uncharacterized protein LOC112345224 [Selaginella moellendorffii]
MDSAIKMKELSLFTAIPFGNRSFEIYEAFVIKVDIVGELDLLAIYFVGQDLCLASLRTNDHQTHAQWTSTYVFLLEVHDRGIPGIALSGPVSIHHQRRRCKLPPANFGALPQKHTSVTHASVWASSFGIKGNALGSQELILEPQHSSQQPVARILEHGGGILDWRLHILCLKAGDLPHEAETQRVHCDDHDEQAAQSPACYERVFLELLNSHLLSAYTRRPRLQEDSRHLFMRKDGGQFSNHTVLVLWPQPRSRESSGGPTIQNLFSSVFSRDTILTSRRSLVADLETT